MTPVEESGADEGLQLPLNALLLRPDVLPTETITASSAADVTFYLWQTDHLEPFPPDDGALLAAAAAGDVVVALTDRAAAPPPWHAFVRDVLNVAGFGSGRRNQGVIVYCAVSDGDEVRWVAYTFGSGSHAVRRRTAEPRFGLIVALNRIALSSEAGEQRAPRLRQASYRAMGPDTFNAGYRASRDTPLDSFRIDRVVDLLSGAGGRTGGEEPGQVFGARALKTRELVSSLDDLVGLATVAVAEFHETHYRDEFAFIDHMRPVFDEALEERLEQQLLDDVLSLRETVDVLLPDDLVPYEDERSICYIVRPRAAVTKACDRVVTVDMVAGVLKRHGADALKQELRFADAEHNIIARATILECLAGEVEVDGDKYVVFDGEFYCVEGSLLDRVHAEVNAIPLMDVKGLPCFPGDAEAAWNKRVAAEDPVHYVTLDGTFVKLPGQSKFEPCDILDVRGALIHAKIKSRSSTMSHLFVQAERSCQLLCEVAEAREQLRRSIAEACAARSIDPAPALAVADALASRNHELRLVFALLGDWHGKSLLNLPLLAKLSLVSTIPAIRRLGFEPSVALVPLCSRP